MIQLLGTLTAWLQSLSGWLQAITGMTIKDLALFSGGILLVIAVLWLGIYGGKPRYREAGRFGWFLLFVAFGIVAYGIYHHDSAPLTPNVRNRTKL